MICQSSSRSSAQSEILENVVGLLRIEDTHLFWVACLVENLFIVDYFMCGHNKLWFRAPLVVGDIVPNKGFHQILFIS